MIIICLLSTLGDVIVTNDCCIVKIVGLIVMESNIYSSLFLS